MMLTKNNTIFVVHLIWLPFGIDLFKQFVVSYKQHISGHEHQLLFLFNGVGNKTETSAYHEYAISEGLIYTSFYMESVQDIEAYKWIALQVDCDYFLFLNSYTKILAGDWLLNYVKNIQDGIGLIGATASCSCYWQDVFKKHTWHWDSSQSFDYNFRKIKLLIKAGTLWRFYFKPFPNYHIRTTGFFISKQLFENISCGKLNNKFAAYLFESGRNSLTNQVIAKGLDVLVIDKFGTSYRKEKWAIANTFWIKEQENLLFADNQTEMYNLSSEFKKKQLTELAWGKYE
ncbi:hypothetical protein [Parasediminibacterium sp. JCM 36343]|uniref:hypothetical protein n=1 Tax=Parasediminibacterium sp. JCM 36343 TaxID=3374279 RepID=UPI0039787242